MFDQVKSANANEDSDHAAKAKPVHSKHSPK